MKAFLDSKLLKRLLQLALVAILVETWILRRFYPYRPNREMAKVLSPELARETDWLASDEPFEDETGSELAQIFGDTDYVHKWRHYFPVYESAFAAFRDRPVRFLEIGVFRGGSLKMWRRYFHPDTVIVGLDIRESCRQFEDPARNIHVRIGKQQDAAFLASVVEEFGPFDIILDDGSHHTSHQIDSFQYLFPNGLADGGVYLVEDVHSNYWRTHRDSRLSFIDYCKGLVDLMHAHYQQTPGELRYRSGALMRRRRFSVPRITLLLDRIEFHDSIIVLRRCEQPKPLPSTVLRAREGSNAAQQ
jgi:hypothetical protein